MREPDQTLVIDLVNGYDVDVDESPWALTPRMALRLIVEAQLVVDLSRGNHDYFMTDWVLPPIAQERATPQFLDRFHQCFESLVPRLRRPQGTDEHLATCVGDEVALRHILTLAEGSAEDGSDTVALEPELSQLPISFEFDDDFDFYNAALFEDRDFDLLWSEAHAWLADDDDASYAHRAINLRPDRWFLPFNAT